MLQGTPENRNFKGFMIQGRVCADDSPAGTFGSGTKYQPQCSGNVSYNICSIQYNIYII